MKLYDELNDSNFLLFAAANYHNPRCIDAEEFYEDLNRFKYIKRLINRYQSNEDLSERLILNHLIVIFNVFGVRPGKRMLEFKIGLHNWHIIKPFLVFLNHIEIDKEYLEHSMDKNIVEALRKI